MGYFYLFLHPLNLLAVSNSFKPFAYQYNKIVIYIFFSDVSDSVGKAVRFSKLYKLFPRVSSGQIRWGPINQR